MAEYSNYTPPPLSQSATSPVSPHTPNTFSSQPSSIRWRVLPSYWLTESQLVIETDKLVVLDENCDIRTAAKEIYDRITNFWLAIIRGEQYILQSFYIGRTYLDAKSSKNFNIHDCGTWTLKGITDAFHHHQKNSLIIVAVITSTTYVSFGIPKHFSYAKNLQQLLVQRFGESGEFRGLIENSGSIGSEPTKYHNASVIYMTFTAERNPILHGIAKRECVQWNPQMRTLLGPRKSVLIRKVS